MGRNKKLGLDYFPMDVDFFQDIRIRKLIKYQGGKAVTVYALLLCIIYKQGYYIRWDDELPFIISEQTGFDEAYIQEVFKCCMVVGLFSKKLYDSDKVITSKGIQERYKNICDQLRRVCKFNEYAIISSEEMPISSEEMPISSEEMPISSEESTQKKRKEKEIKKENSLSRVKEIFPPPDIFDKGLSECYNELSSDESWMEIVTMNTRNSGHKDFTTDVFKLYLKRFFEKLQNEGEVRKSPKDAKAHFARWMNIELKKKTNYEQRTTNSIYEQKRIDSERRKSKLMAEFAEADSRFLAEQEAKRKADCIAGEIPDTFQDGG